ncbi:MAG TPA: 3-phosphoshikimate 1-carboxyvinyltransferase [Alphaproteobacteria bacterium]|nr:3-phosphoshikimate 1-carboxyvinyltransferase [Alphaproteobacteria bacterium]
MIATITPFPGPIQAEVSVPGSKSLSNRALVVASLAEGASRLSNILHSDDTRFMMRHLSTLGVTLHATDDVVEIEGTSGCFPAVNATLFCGNAGTTVRFLTALCTLVPGAQTITGDDRMQQRPIRDLVEGLLALGADVEAPSGCPPVRVRSAGLRGGSVSVRAHRSSQYLSGLLMIAPYAQGAITIDVASDMVSESYVELTLEVMAAFGVAVERPAARRFIVPRQRYKGRAFAIEGDATSAGYWWGLAALTGSRITVANVQPASSQGDVALLQILERMGCQVSFDRGITVQGPSILKSPGTVDMNRLPDGVMTLAVVAALAEGETRLVNVANLRIKESDRLAALVSELRRVGIAADELSDGIRIQGGKPHGAEIETYADHRMAMSFAILGARVPGISLRDPGCVSKSYPTFFEQLEALRAST